MSRLECHQPRWIDLILARRGQWDFRFDVTTDQRPIKIVSIIGERTRECLGGAWLSAASPAATSSISSTRWPPRSLSAGLPTRRPMA